MPVGRDCSVPCADEYLLNQRYGDGASIGILNLVADALKIVVHWYCRMKVFNKYALPKVVAAGCYKAGFLLVLHFILLSAKAQEIFIPKPAIPLTSFRFEQMIGGIVLLRGTLNNYPDSLNFILDSGSGGISLDSLTVSELKLPIVPTNRTIKGIAGIRTLNYTKHHTLHLPGLTIDSLDFHINDYELLSSIYGLRIDGIMGYSVLHRYIVQVDYDQKMLHFYAPGAFKYKRGGTILRPAINGLPIQAATVKDAKKIVQRFYLDTGGGLCLLLSEEFVKDSSLFTPKKKILPTITEGLGGKKEMQITTVKELKVGPYKFKKVPTYVFADDYNVTSYPSLGGLIGADLLRRFNLTINYPKGEIHLLPNTHFKDAFDYSYSGMELMFDAGKALVGEVIPNSPAYKCGLKVDDEIMAVNNNVGVSFQEIKTLLQNTDNKIKLIVRRRSELLEIVLKVDRIY